MGFVDLEVFLHILMLDIFQVSKVSISSVFTAVDMKWQFIAEITFPYAAFYSD